MAGSDVFCISGSRESQEILRRVEREATFSYQVLTLAEEQASNVLCINGTLIHRSIEEIPLSYEVHLNNFINEILLIM